MKVPVTGPCDDLLVLKGIGEHVSFKDTWSGFQDTVLHRLDAVLHSKFPVHFGNLCRKGLLIVIFPFFLPAQGVVPCIEFCLCNFGGILDIKGVKFVQFEAVSCLHERIADCKPRG